MKIAFIAATLAAGFGRDMDESCPGIPFPARLGAVCLYAMLIASLGSHLFEL